MKLEEKKIILRKQVEREIVRKREREKRQETVKQKQSCI